MTKPHNYISPLPPQEQEALHRWYTLSAYFIIGLIIILTLINIYQYIIIRNLQVTYHTINVSLQNLQRETQKYEQLQQEYTFLDKRAAKIHAILNNHTFNPCTHLQEITHIVPGNVCLTEFTCSKKKGISFQGYAYAAESAITFMTKLQQLPHMKQLQLMSLSPLQSQETGKTWYQFHVKKFQK